MNMETVW